MCRLISFELQKVWCKRSFLFSVCTLLILNVFLLWYTNLGGERTPELSSYKRFQSDIAAMSEPEKTAYIENLKQTIDGVSFVRSILAMQNSEMGAVLAVQEMNAHPGMFEAYYNLYVSDGYLHYTNSLELESVFIDELYAEEYQVATYDAYLRSVQERKDVLGGVSIFGKQDENSFSFRNVQKSAADYAGLTTDGIRWIPSKTIVSTIESTWTDIFLILLVFLFIGILITEEKQKELFYITRSTKYGISHCILSKLSALFIHCLVFSAVFFCLNYLFFGFSAGWCDVTAKLQSLAPYTETNLSISILGYLLLSVLTKSLIIFGTGAMLTAVCILSENVVLPYLLGLLFWAISWMLYQFIPAVSKLSMAKHINLFGILRTENLYGTYLNLNFGGYPFSRVVLSWIVIGIVVLSGIILTYVFFLKGKGLQIKRLAKRFTFPFRPHNSLIRHESYKILITNHALAILLVFGTLIGYNELRSPYTPSVQEQYYRDIMLQLEGQHTDEKNRLIESEAERYRQAFEEINRIDAAVASGELDEKNGESMKLKWYGVTAFYPAFQRVEQQNQFVSENGGKYIYDIGYLYLLDILGDGTLNDFLFLTMGIILAFSHVVSMEYQNGAWGILYATRKGKHGIITRKIVVCVLATAIFSALPLVCRFISVSAAFPIHGLLFAARNIPFYHNWASHIPAIGLILLKLILQVISGVILTTVMIVFSGWRKSHIQAIFFGFLILCVPIILTVLGFDFAKWFSPYPLYSCILSVSA